MAAARVDAEAPPLLARRPSAAQMSRRGLAWSGLGFSVAAGGALPALGARARGPAGKHILQACAGLVRAGEVCYVMGASGSGKSSTLDSLAGRVRADVEGEVWLDGRPTEGARGVFREKVKYVEQEDHLFEVLSVEETLWVAARLQQEERGRQRVQVEGAIRQLGLESCRGTKVGGTFYRGCSGGQRRRLAIGVELVAEPRVILGDELSSGLDSKSSQQVMQHLRDVARSGVAVVCTIHQPSQRVFALSDKLLLLSQGRMVYFGKTSEAVAYFQRHGAVIPEQTSAAEFLVEQVNTDYEDNKELVDRLIAAWPLSPECAALEVETQEWLRMSKDAASSEASHQSDSADAASMENGTGRGRSFYKRSLSSQVGILAMRNFKDALRNPAVIYLRFAMYFALCIMIGIAWWRVPFSANRISDLLGAIVYANGFLIFMSIAVLPVYISERKIVTRERMNGSYSVAAYMLGHFVVEMLMLGVLSIACAAALYPMVGLDPSVSKALFWALTLWISLLVAESIMILIASMIPIFSVGIAAGAMLYGAFMVVQGYFIPLKYVPWVIRWLSYVAVHSYSFAAMVINEFEGTVYEAAPDSLPPFPNAVDGESIIASRSFNFNNKWANIGAIFAMLVFYRICASLWIAKFHDGKK